MLILIYIYIHLDFYLIVKFEKHMWVNTLKNNIISQIISFREN